MTKKRKVENNESVVVVFKNGIKDGTAIEVHRHTIEVKFHDGDEQSFQRGKVFSEVDRDLAVEYFNKNR